MAFNNSKENSMDFQQQRNYGTSLKKDVTEVQPIMRNVAVLYGTHLMDQGKVLVDKELNKYFSLVKLKAYFSVDINYVLRKLKILLFPYNNKVWSLKVRGQQARPRDDVNAPDLYIPLMAYLTFILLASIVIGTESIFSPEVIGVVASRTIIYVFLELIVQIFTMYVTNLKTEIEILDLLSFSSYKFVGMNIALLLNRLMGRIAYYIGIIYTGISLTLFLIRSLKWRTIVEIMPPFFHAVPEKISLTDGYQGRRRFYFLLWIGLSQPFLMWWLSYNLYNQQESFLL